MSKADEVLAQIDAAVDDWAVSGDAMRCRPAPAPPAATTVVAASGREQARAVLVRRLTDRHGLAPATARAAVLAAETGEPNGHLELVSAEARAAVGDAARHVGEVMAAFVRALQPMAQAAAATLCQLDETIRTASRTAGAGQDRPAWQSPYGPPQKTRTR